ncbi:MAG: 4-hydroxy-3-methylbut-2-enyl diphosphate reductase [Deltaproteobacteria bacterium]|jgi:4-hydroxy-3-methylbut-2-enyl diphosphate reductase|nr:4-hydroxy-3-methylbut-2-enyl diphosphate reductase [Deltaproteobacteria bacterium]
MQVIKAASAGFCMGVSLALRRLDQALAARRARGQAGEIPPGSRLYTIGPIIHNPQLVREYEERGALCLRDLSAIRAGDTAVIRAHGLPGAVEDRLRALGVEIVDATCPRVKAAQLAIRKASQDGGTLLLFGEAEHPEVKGLLSYAGHGARVFGNLDELKKISLPDKFFLAAQTTQDKEIFAEAAEYVTCTSGRNVAILDTICDATRQRQDEVSALAARVRGMVIVGGLNSGNTTRLADIARNMGVFTLHCENGYTIPLDKLKELQPVGLSAGASTPDEQINTVEELLRRA